jgi:hypothetical protein
MTDKLQKLRQRLNQAAEQGHADAAAKVDGKQADRGSDPRPWAWVQWLLIAIVIGGAALLLIF